MTTPATDHDRAVRIYARLIDLHPKAHRDAFGPQMQRDFEDTYRHATEGERRAGIGFWLAVVWHGGRSIVRERAAEPQGDALFLVLVLIWAFALLIVPVIPGAGDWRNLVIPTAVLAALLLAVPGRAGIARRFVTVVVAAAVIEGLVYVEQSISDQSNLLAPALLLACMAFSIKTVAGLNARIVERKDSVWVREEMAYGLLIGLAGVVGLVLALLNPSDDNPGPTIIFNLLAPLLCGVAGFQTSWRNQSTRSGIYAALGSLLIGAAIWFLAEPMVVEGALMTVLRDHQVPAATLLPYWQRPLSTILFTAAIFGILGAIFGHITRVEATRRSTSQP
jgi:hypothetical protein